MKVQQAQVAGVHGARADAERGRAADTRPGAFAEALELALGREGVKLSKHARERISARDIRIGEAGARRIADTMDRLRDKGAKVSLLFVGDKALVTNVSNRTVITALDRYGAGGKVFTQIDSAAVIEEG